MKKLNTLLAVVAIVALFGIGAKASVIRIYPSDALTLQLDLTKATDNPAYLYAQPWGTTVGVAGTYPWSIYRTLLKFDLSSIPDGSLVTAAKMHMTAYATFPTQEGYVQLAERMGFDTWDDSAVNQAGYVSCTVTQVGAAVRLLEENNNVTWDISTSSWDFAADLIDNAVTMQVRYAQEGNYEYKGTVYYNLYDGWQANVWPYLELTVVPEPGTMALLGIGGIVLRRRR